MNVFDISTPKQFLHSIRCRYNRYREPVQNGGRTTEDILYVVMGLTHLREWIAPEKSPKKYRPESSTAAQNFSSSMYDDENYKKILDVTNGVKHLRRSETVTSSAYGSTVDDWADWDAVASIDNGPPISHYIDGISVETVINPILEKYETLLDDTK
jgi:hypothetical protein